MSYLKKWYLGNIDGILRFTYVEWLCREFAVSREAGEEGVREEVFIGRGQNESR